ncbi:MAG: FHA domain-containing protein [Dehalococcoidia bacterium]
MPRLTASVARPATGEEFAVEFEGDVTLGRGRDAAIRLADPMVSRTHASLSLRSDGALVVQDHGSTNGTIVNGTLVFGEVAVFGWPVVIEIDPFRITISSSPEESTLRDQVVGWQTGDTFDPPPIGATWLDTVNWRLVVDGEVALDGLSPAEFTVLNYLCSVAPQVVRAQDLGDALWGGGRWDMTMLQELVAGIRRRLTAVLPGRRVIVNVPGEGYRIE